MNEELNMSIDTAVPVPQKIKPRQLLNKLEIGQSFSFPKDKRSSIANSVSGYFHVLTDKRFTISIDPEDNNMYRVWRIDNDETRKAS